MNAFRAREQSLVKAPIALIEGRNIQRLAPSCLIECGEDLLELDQVLLGAIQRSKMAGLLLEHASDLEQLRYFFRIESCNEVASSRAQYDKALGIQPAQRFTHGQAAHAKLGGNFFLTYRSSSPKLATQDGL